MLTSPSAHALQLAALVPPGSARKVPGGQLAHAPAVALGMYLPGPHTVQPFWARLNRVHAGQLEHALEPGAEIWFPHGTQPAVAPPVTEKVLAGHRPQPPAPSPTLPEAQYAHAVAPRAGVIWKRPHSVQKALPALAAKEPSPHGVQLAAPAEALKLPGAHGVHCAIPAAR